jgi:hypothetical protein
MKMTAGLVKRSLVTYGASTLVLVFVACSTPSRGNGGSGGSPSSGGQSSSGGSSASGGISGSGGSSSNASGGQSGSGGSTATGTGGSSALSCASENSPADPLLSDFSATSWNAASGRWGTPGNLTGSIFSYSGSTDKTMSAKVSSGSLVVSGDVAAGSYGGAGMAFATCINTAKYTGFQFTLGGSTAGCDLLFQVQTFSQQAASSGGGCASGSSCYNFPAAKVQIADSPVTVHFADLANTGMPAAAADLAKEIVGAQWQLQSASPAAGAAQSDCSGINLTIDDVKFVSDTATSGTGGSGGGAGGTTSGGAGGSTSSGSGGGGGVTSSGGATGAGGGGGATSGGGATGAGGSASGSGGGAGSGGPTAGAGGATSSGGSTGTGGASATGGATGSGAGGSTGAGGSS